MNITALDLSLTATGWARSDGQCDVYTPPKSALGVRRLVAIRNAMLGYAANADLVVIEGYAFGRIQQAHHLGELGGVVRIALHEAGHTVIEIPPASLKMFATGKGNAAKDEVLAAAIRKLGYAGHDHNVSDALWLKTMAMCHYLPTTGLTEYQQRAFAKITWPKLAKAAA